MKAFKNNADILKYSQKLNNLNDDNLFLIASSYEAEVFEKKVFTINSIINKIKNISKEDFIEFDKQINEMLIKKDKKELVKKRNAEPEILISDRIFFIFTPNVNVNNAKLFYLLPINVAITIYSMIFLTVFYSINFNLYFKSYINFEISDYIIMPNFPCSIFLFISMTNENSSFAKISLILSEIFFPIVLFELDFKVKIEQILNYFLNFLWLYISYIQLIVAKNKENKKLKE